MKKLILSFAVLATLAATSCGTSVKKAEDEGAVIKAKIENCTNPDSLKIYVQQAKDYAAKLVKDGDDSAAKAYLSEVAPVVQAKDPSAAGVFSGLKAEADSALTTAKNAVDSAATKTGEAVKGAVDATKDKAAEVGNAVSDKASEVGNAVADKASDVKQKTADAVQAGADKVKEALGKQRILISFLHRRTILSPQISAQSHRTVISTTRDGF